MVKFHNNWLYFLDKIVKSYLTIVVNRCKIGICFGAFTEPEIK